MNGAEEIVEAAQIIRRGGIVAFPTETVYGLGADAFAPLAVARIFEVKRRPHFDPLIVHVATPSDVKRLVVGIPGDAQALIDRFWPGPLTVVLRKQEAVPDLVTAGLPTVAFRMPDHPMALRLIELCGSPIAAPSANPFGYLSPTTAEHVREQLVGQVDFILNGGPCAVGVESTIVSLAEGRPKLLRPGGVSLEEIESVIGKVETPSTAGERPDAPGMLAAHYAPHTPIRVIAGTGSLARYRKREKKIGLLGFRSSPESDYFQAVEILSAGGDLREAAANFFSALRRLDALDLDVILAEPLPEIGLGRAIMDRLRRASHKNMRVESRHSKFERDSA